MLLKEVLKVAPCYVNLYVDDGDDYKDLWCGDYRKIPDSFLDCIVRVIGPSGRILDVELENNQKLIGGSK